MAKRRYAEEIHRVRLGKKQDVTGGSDPVCPRHYQPSALPRRGNVAIVLPFSILCRFENFPVVQFLMLYRLPFCPEVGASYVIAIADDADAAVSAKVKAMILPKT